MRVGASPEHAVAEAPMDDLGDGAKLRGGAATSAGYYVSSLGSRHPKVQILTVAELLDGRKIDYPSQGVNLTFERAPRERSRTGKQKTLGLE